MHFKGGLNDGIIFTLVDAWVLDAGRYKQARHAAWTPIDHAGPTPAVTQYFKDSGSVPVAMSRHGHDALKAEGLDPLYVPHGIDTEVFKPTDRTEARKKLGLPEDAFIVAMVAANKGFPSRKSFPEVARAFKALADKHDDAYLFLHTEALGLNQGMNIPNLLGACKIPPERVQFSEQYQLLTGQHSPADVATLYNAANVLINPAHGEGFGIPVLEAQACGTPVIVQDFTAMKEVGEVGWHVGGQENWTGQQAWQRIPNIDELIWALEEAYRDGDRKRELAREHALKYDADRVTKELMLPALDEIQERTKKIAPVQPIRDLPTVTVVTPWYGHAEFLSEWERALSPLSSDDAIFVVDNASDPPIKPSIHYEERTRFKENRGFSAACNHGLGNSYTDAVLFLNNDIEMTDEGWLEAIRRELKPGVLVGANLRRDAHTQVDGEPIEYLDGWCIAGMREDLLKLGGWDEDYEEPSYYGDNDLCFRAVQAGMKLVEVEVGLRHLENGTAKDFDVTGVTRRNYERFAQKVREARGVRAAA